MTPEGRVKDSVKKWLKTNGIWYFMPAANGFGKAGIPDFIACYEGRFVAIETKAPGKIDNLTENQKARIEEIRRAGGVAVVVDSPLALEESFRGIDIANSDFR